MANDHIREATKKIRLIDANALKEKAFPEEVSGEGIVLVQDIDEAPTVDAVEVVRCKDCKRGKIDTLYGSVLYHCLGGYGYNKADHFCSYGERKDND